MGVVVERSQEPLKILTVVNYRNVQVVRCLVLRQREWTCCFQVI